MRYTTEEKHISTIRHGDLIVHEGVLSTVCDNNIKRDSFMGLSIFGDCYRMGCKPVLKATVLR